VEVAALVNVAPKATVAALGVANVRVGVGNVEMA
jgi:hypothetical protein